MLGLLLSVSAVHAAHAQSQTASMHLDIEAQSLSSALSEFARQCDRQIFFPTEIVERQAHSSSQRRVRAHCRADLVARGHGAHVQRPARQIDSGPLDRGTAGSTARLHANELSASGAGINAETPTSNPSSATAPIHQDRLAIEEEVIVRAFRARTATKTDVQLTETPQAISIITADEITNRGAIGLQEALRYTAGMRTEINGSDLRFDYFSSRGFAATDYVDGMVLPDSSSIPRTEVYNLERVEVLRGPSSVLYGQGTAGGIVNSMTKRPRSEFAAEFGLEYGDYNRKQAHSTSPAVWAVPASCQGGWSA